MYMLMSNTHVCVRVRHCKGHPTADFVHLGINIHTYKYTCMYIHEYIHIHVYYHVKKVYTH